MNTLIDLQRQFQNYLLNTDREFEKAVAAKSKTAAQQRLMIYHEAYRLRLVDILKIDFPGLYQWLGDKKFTKLALNYIEQYPSQFFSAREFGRYLANNLAQAEPYNKDNFLAEFATFERTLSETIDTPNAPLLTPEHVMSIPPESWGTMRLTLHPTVTLLNLHWNIPEIRQALLAEQPKPKRRRQMGNWLIWRQNIDVRYKALDEKECFIIQKMKAQATFEEICEGLMQWLPEQEAVQYIVRFLQIWLPEQIFSKADLSEAP